MKRAYVIFLLVLTSLFAGCYKNDIMRTYHPERGLVILVVDPPELEEGEVMPSSYVLNVNGVKGYVDDGQVTFASLVEPGVYDIRVYNETEAIKIDDDGVASTASDGEFTKLSDSHVYFGAGALKISADYNDKIEVEVKPVTRKLKFEIAVTEGDIDKIDNIYMSLSGVASGWDCLKGETIGEAKSVESHFDVMQTKGSRVDASDGYYLTSSLYLLGTVGSEHELNVVITYKNGHKQTIISALDRQLDDFNSDKSSMKLMQSTTALLSESEYSATIVDWVEADESLDFEIGPGEALR